MGSFDKFNKMIDLEGLLKDIADITANNTNGEYKDVPLGTYECKIVKMELGKTKAGDKVMLKVQFKILAGEYKNSCIFMNQVMQTPFQIINVVTFLNSLQSGIDFDFKDYNQLNDLILECKEKINGKLEFAIEYGENKGYKTFKVVEVFKI